MGIPEEAAKVAAAAGLELVDTPEGLTLTDGTLELRADLAGMLPRVRADRLGRELLVRAARVRGASDPVAIDATAGFGEDSFLLAAAGFTCELFERDPVIAALLADALDRAAQDEKLAPIAARMHLNCGDSLTGMAELAATGMRPSVVFLDPMFPGRTKSAAVKKKFQLLHHLECPCSDERALVDAALACFPKKIVIKRPLKGPFLADVKPSYQLKGKAVRYDVLVPPSA